MAGQMNVEPKPISAEAFTTTTRKIDPSRKPALRPDGSPDDNDRVEIGPTPMAFAEWEAAELTPPNLARMRRFRLDRLVEQVRLRGLDGLLLTDPLNIRYATDTTNMSLWNAHNPFRAVLVTADGHMVLWDFKRSGLLSAFNPRSAKCEVARRCSISSPAIGHPLPHVSSLGRSETCCTSGATARCWPSTS